MNLKTTLLLLAVLVLAVVAMLVLQCDGDDANDPGNPQEQQAENADAPIIPEAFFAGGLTMVGLDIDGEGDDLRLSLERGRWFVSLPHDFPAKTAVLDELLSLLAGLQGHPIADHFVPSDPTGVYLYAADRMVSVELGDRLGGGRGVVFVTQGTTTRAYDVPDTLHDYFAGLDPAVFYDDAIPTLLMPEIGRIELTSNLPLSALYQQDGRWWIEHDSAPERALEQSMPGGPDGEGYPGIDAYFRLLRSVELLQNKPYNFAEDLRLFGLHEPLATVRFIPLDEDPTDESAGWLLQIGLPDGVAEDDQGTLRQTRFISFGRADDRTPPVFSTYSDTAMLFPQDATYFRDPRIATLDVPFIGEIEATTPGGPDVRFAFGNDSVTHQVGDNTPEELTTPQDILGILDPLVNPRAIAFLDGNTPDLTLLMSARITTPQNSEGQSFAVYADPGSTADKPTVLVRRGNEPVLLRVDRAAVRSLLISARPVQPGP